MTDALIAMHEAETAQAARLHARRAYRLDEEAYTLSQSAFARMKQESVALTEVLTLPCTVMHEPNTAATFCTSLEKHLRAVGVTLHAHSLLTESERGEYGEHVAYPQNRFTERAYHRLTRRMKRPSVTYCTDFANACAEVRDGLADLCILPLRDEEGAYLRRFLHLLEEYGLSVREYAFEEGEEGEGTYYALCGRGVILPSYAKTLALELSLPARSDNDAAFFASLVKLLGGELLAAEILPDAHTKATLARLAFRIEGKRLASFLLAARLFTADAWIFGMSACNE